MERPDKEFEQKILAIGLDRVGLWIESQRDRKQEPVGTREAVPLLGKVSGIPVLQGGEDVNMPFRSIGKRASFPTF